MISYVNTVFVSNTNNPGVIKGTKTLKRASDTTLAEIKKFKTDMIENEQMQSAQESILRINQIIREMPIKTTMRYHLMLFRIAIIKSLQIINAGEGVKKKEPSLHC